MRVLIIDDDRLALRSTSRALRAAGHSIMTAEDATHAGHILRHHPDLYQALVTDNDLVGSDSGAKLSAFFSTMLAEPKCVVVFTGNPIEAARDAPAGASIIKKPNITQVVAVLKRAEQGGNE